MSEHSHKDFLVNNIIAELGVAATVTVAGLSVLGITKFVRARRQSEALPKYNGHNIHEAKAASRRLADDTIDLLKASEYRDQLSLLRDETVNQKNREVLIKILAQVYDTTSIERAGSIRIRDLHDRVNARSRLFDKSLGRLIMTGLVLNGNDDIPNGRIEGVYAGPALIWVMNHGSIEDAPGLHDVASNLAEARVLEYQGYLG